MVLHCKRKKKVFLWVDLSAHVIVITCLAVYFYFKTGGLLWSFFCVLGGILIDVDHFIDYFLCYGPRFKIRNFIYGGYLITGKFYVLFHSWELLFILWVVSVWHHLMVPLAASMTGHLLIDQFLVIRKKPLSYSLIYRYLHGFNVQRTFPAKNNKIWGE